MMGLSAAASFTMPESTVDMPKKPSKNTIFSSVANNPAKSFVAPSFSLPTEPKIASSVVTQSVQNGSAKISQAVSGAAKTLPVVPTLPVAPAAIPVPKEIVPAVKSVPVVAELPKEPAVIMPEDLSIKSVEPEDEADDAVEDKVALPVEKDKEPEIENKKEEAKEEEDVKLPGVLYQQHGFVDDDVATIAFNFEDASLSNLLSYMETIHNIKFITEDIVATAKDAKGAPVTGVAGHKISFRTNKNLTRKESWDLFLTFMHIAGLDVIPMVQHQFYRIVSLAKANTEPIPTYIGVDYNVLPDSDMIVRYVYFTRNVDPTKIQPLLKNMQSGSAKLDVYAELKGLIFTDRANSIKSLMQIVSELDKAVLPEVVSVVKLKRTNVNDVIKLYNSLKPNSAAGGQQQQKVWVQSKKESTLDYFPSDVVLQGDLRTNSLIVLGAARDVQRIEEFVTKYIDIAIDRGAPPIYTYPLQYTNASDVLKVVNEMVKYSASIKPAGDYGGVRDGIKFFQKMNIVADSFTNSLIINSTPEDYEALKPLIAELDVPQRQVGLEVLIVQVTDTDTKTLGAQVSGPNGIGSPVAGASPYGPTFGQGTSGQTSGIPSGTPIVVTAGQSGQDDFSVKSSLAQLLGTAALNEVGSVLVTFGQPIWAIFKILKTITSTHLVANPFVVVSSNSTASITSGEQRRLVSGEVVSVGGTTTRGFTPINATLTVNITPQINKNNMVNLQIDVNNSVFTQAESTSSSSTSQGSPINTNEVKTRVSVANGETLVLGGIMSEQYSTSSSGVPFLENIPIVGWFFKGKTRKISRSHFMIFVCPRVLDPINEAGSVDKYSAYKLQEVQDHLDLIDQSDWFASPKDPVQKAFFGAQNSPSLQQLYTSDNYDQRKKLDGKIDEPVKKSKNKTLAQKKTSVARKRSSASKKQTKKQKESPSSIPIFLPSEEPQSKPLSGKNSIVGSIQPGKGA